MKTNDLKDIAKTIINDHPEIKDLLLCGEHGSNNLSFDELCNDGYINFDVNEETVSSDSDIPCKLYVTYYDDTLHVDVICTHEKWRLNGFKQRPIEISSVMFESIHGKTFPKTGLLHYIRSDYMVLNEVLCGFGTIYTSDDVLYEETDNPFIAYDVITEEILNRIAASDTIRNILYGDNYGDVKGQDLLDDGKVRLSHKLECDDTPVIILDTNYNGDYSISTTIIFNNKEVMLAMNTEIRNVMRSIYGMKVGRRDNINSLSDDLLCCGSNFTLDYDPDTIHTISDEISYKPHFFCDAEVMDYLVNMETDDSDAINGFTLSFVEIPFWFSFSCDNDTWFLNSYRQGDLFVVDEEKSIQISNLSVDKKTGDGSGEVNEELKDLIEVLFYACHNLSCFIQNEKMHHLFTDLDPEYSGIQLYVEDETLKYKIVTGAERPELTCLTLMGDIVQGRLYWDDFLDRSRLDMKSWDEVIELAEEGDIEAMDRAFDAYMNGYEGIEYSVDIDHEKAFYWLKKIAEAGNSNGMFNLGLHYAKGFMVERDFEKAAYWMEKAAEAGDEDAIIPAQSYKKMADSIEPAKSGDSDAQAVLAAGFMQLGGSLDQAGEGDNYKESLKWAKLATDQNNASAFWTLGLAYDHGRGVEQDSKKAFESYEKGAELGDPNCQHSLGCFYMRGDIVKEDRKKAFQLFLESAKQGYGLAMRDVGRCYQFGIGTMGNMKTAVEWYEKACEVLNDPELEETTDLFKSLAEVDEHYGEDYPGDFDEDGNEINYDSDKYMTGIAPDEVSNAWRYEDELDQQGYLPDMPHGDEAWGEMPRVHQKALEGDQKAIDILKALDELG